MYINLLCFHFSPLLNLLARAQNKAIEVMSASFRPKRAYKKPKVGPVLKNLLAKYIHAYNLNMTNF